MNISKFVKDLLARSNAYDTEKYLELWQEKAVLNDPSVGQVFKGHAGVRKYFKSYFIGYQTQSRLVRLDIMSPNEAHIEVEFTGKFPEGKITGTFDFVFKEGKIDKAKADLV